MRAVFVRGGIIGQGVARLRDTAASVLPRLQSWLALSCYEPTRKQVDTKDLRVRIKGQHFIMRGSVTLAYPFRGWHTYRQSGGATHNLLRTHVATVQ